MTPAKPANTAPPTEEELRQTVVEVDGVEGLLVYPPVWQDGALYLHGATLLRMTRTWPYARNYQNQVYLHVDSFRDDCTLEWLREEQPNRLRFTCHPELERPDPTDLWRGHEIYRSWVLFHDSNDWRQGQLDPDWYPWVHSGNVVEFDVPLPMGRQEASEKGLTLVLKIQAEVLYEGALTASVSLNDEPAGEFEASSGKPGSLSLPVTGYEDRIRIRVGVPGDGPVPRVTWSFNL